MGEEDELTLEEVGARFGITRERVRQIEAKALRRLGRKPRIKALHGYLQDFWEIEMIEQKTRSVPPRPSAMVRSLRGLGYSTATALADIIDNSIAAGANNVSLGFVWNNNASSIFVFDNGRGMTEQELVSAMRLGGIAPKESRHPSDLGRFGLGLKTASFSQGRCLTVASKTNAGLSCFRWDLDALADDEWSLYEGPTLAGEGFAEIKCTVVWDSGSMGETRPHCYGGIQRTGFP